MNKIQSVLFMAGILLALAFTFSCSSDDSSGGDSGGNGSWSSSDSNNWNNNSSSSNKVISSSDGGNSSENSGLSSSSNNGDNHSSGSVAVISSSDGGSSSGNSSSSSVSGSSSSSGNNSSSSSNGGGSSSGSGSSSSLGQSINPGKECDAIFNPDNKFCYDGVVYDKCGGNTYNPVTQGCANGKIEDGCGGKVYSQATQFCYDDIIYAKCDGMVYNPTTHICQNGVATPAKCNGESYNPVTQGCCNNSKIFSQTAQRCVGGIVEDKCGDTWYSQATQFCVDNIIYTKCNGMVYSPVTQYCGNGTAVTTYGSVTYQGQTYKTVIIGTQTWMAENLNYAAGGSLCYNDIVTNCATYGRLYDWLTAMALNSNNSCPSINAKHQGICPSGWHIPSNADWNVLMKFIYPSCPDNYNCANAGTKLKATSGWNSYSGISVGTDDFGFSALPGGKRSGSNFSLVGNNGTWWSADGSCSDVLVRGIYYNYEYVEKNYTSKSAFLSVRCVKD